MKKESETAICVDCGGCGFTEDFETMSVNGTCKTCGGTGKTPLEVGSSAFVLPEVNDPMGRGFMRRIVSRELYAKGKGTMSTMECGHVNSGPTSCADDYEKPCLTCEANARHNDQALAREALPAAPGSQDVHKP